MKKPYSKEYKCSKCEVITHSVSSFKRHWKTQHSQPRKYMCLNCGSVTSRYDTYLKHRKTFHKESPNHGYDILNYSKNEQARKPECKQDSVKDCMKDRKKEKLAVRNEKPNETLKQSSDICNFVDSSESHNQLFMREFPRYSMTELNPELFAVPQYVKPQYMNPAPNVNCLSQPEKVDLFVSEADLDMQEYIIANTKPVIQKRRDWDFIPLPPHEQSMFPERP